MNVLSLFAGIKHIILDVDGVLTNGEVLLLPDGDMVRTMHTKDGFAMQLAIKKGYGISVITGGTSTAVAKRLQGLGITDVFISVKDKVEILHGLIEKNKLRNEEIAFIGDDIPDFDAMQLVGMPCCPSDAVPEIKQISKYISPFEGGKGCVRDILEKILKLNGDWDVHATVPSI